MAGRPRKLTTDEHDRADQRRRTQDLIDSQQGMQSLPVKPPTYLHGIARKAWNAIVPMLNKNEVITAADAYSVTILCEQIEMEQRAYKDIRENGITTKIFKTVVTPLGEVKGTDFVGYRRNPATQVLSDASAKIKTQCDALGMTPTSRAQLLSLVHVDDDEEELTMDDILGKKADDF
ncbi:phage terminase small subunit P27 family [Lacticaseibacillus pantheris]|uniref:phage terminase small subunit P27 family n=1 Tax=Lacticaseibacillus pantheris TaxID=171523 RepID=UPI00265AF38D|nr:phage terminase small subunit P27 family [Lacticaseibacillus pantheris]WKF86016.1 phage terminase small subunit P27 family [Lacticaseibacillus pantheris]